MKIMSKEINESGTNLIIYVMDDGGSPLKCEYANNENKNNVINELTNQFSGIVNFEQMTYNEYINQ
jgi:hypothetical protein